MAYTTPNRALIRPWEKNGRKRYRVYTQRLLVGTDIQQVATGGGVTAGSTGVANGIQVFRGPGRIVGLQYGLRDTTGTEALIGATGGALTVKAETTAGAQIWTDADISVAGTIQDGFAPVGTTAVDEARGATAATDGFSGGFPVRGGVFAAISGGTDGEAVYIDYLVRHCTYAKVVFSATSGADGSGVASTILRLGGPGVLAAVAVDFQNMPATTDLTITADDATTGTALFTSTNSLTDLAPSLIGRPGLDEAVAATAATDGTECANGFKNQLVVAMADADIFTSSNEKIVVEMWIDD